MTTKLHPALADAIAERQKVDSVFAGRCKPQCYPRYWTDAPAVNGMIRTFCGRCGVWIGYRPVAGK